MTRWVSLVALAAVVGIAVFVFNEDGPQGVIDGPVLSEPEGDGIRSIMLAGLRGAVVYDETEGCLYLGLAGHLTPVIWPPGTSWRPEPPGVVLADGTVVEPGDYVEGAGGGVAVGNLSRRVGDAVEAAVAGCGNGATMLQGITRILRGPPSENSNGAGPPSVAVMPCRGGIERVGTVPADFEVILDVLALPSTGLERSERTDPGTGLTFSEMRLLVRTGASFRLDVAPGAAEDARIHWDSTGTLDPVSTMVTDDCTFDGEWLAYSGGVWTRDPSCVRLVISMGSARDVVDLPIGEPCT